MMVTFYRRSSGGGGRSERREMGRFAEAIKGRFVLPFKRFCIIQ